MLIGGLQKITLIDFPGKIAATVFLSGCSFRCPWCYNPELVLPEKIKDHPKIPEKDFFDFLKDRKNLLEGVCITGGEPTINEDLPDFIKKIKKLDYLVKLDTNGSNPKMLKELIADKLIDYVAMDIKAPREKYNETIGMFEQCQPIDPNSSLNCWSQKILDNVEESVNILKEGNVDFEFRTTIIPTFHKKEDIVKIVRWISPAKKYFLQNFRPEKTVNPEFLKIKPYTLKYILGIQKAIAPFFEVCQVR